MSRILEQWSGRLVMLITHDSSLVESSLIIVMILVEYVFII